MKISELAGGEQATPSPNDLIELETPSGESRYAQLSALPNGLGRFANIAVDSGTINGTEIGASVAAKGQFTELSSNGFQDNAVGRCMTLEGTGTVKVGEESGQTSCQIQLRNNPGDHHSETAGSTLRFGTGGAIVCQSRRNDADSFNDEYLEFYTHEGGVHASRIGVMSPNGSFSLSRGRMSVGGDELPESGCGMEIGFDGTSGVVAAYDRDGGAALPLNIESHYVRFLSSGSELARLSDSGHLLVGVASGAAHEFSSNAVQGQLLSQFTTGGGTETNAVFALYAAQSGRGSNVSTAARLMMNTVTGRSLNAEGTVNSSGADYAEYEYKRDDCDSIAKGDLVGFDAQGLLTDRWNFAISFAVKSTQPGYVGGDIWGGDSELGTSPGPVPVLSDFPDEAAWLAAVTAHNTRQALFEEALEVSRARVDRIAYCGKVPVNHHGEDFQVGDMVLAAPDTQSGGIRPRFVGPDDLDWREYLRSVGQVRSVGSDGRPIVCIKPI